jgi:hypothetical protein
MLFLGISLTCIALYLGALAGLLQWTAWGLWGLGGIAFVFWCLIEFRRGNSLATVWVPLVLIILFWWIHADSQFLYWDEYSHWGTYVREMSVTHQLWTAETNAAHPDYPPLAALWQYFIILPFGYSEGGVYLAQFILLLAPLTIFFEFLSGKRLIWIPFLLAFFALGLANYGHGISSLYMDHLLSVWYSGIVLWAYRLYLHEVNWTHWFQLVFPLSVLILLKDSALPLTLSGIVLVSGFALASLYSSRKTIPTKFWWKRTLIVVLLLTLIPLSFRLSWHFNREAEGISRSGKESASGLIAALLVETSTVSPKLKEQYEANFTDVILHQQLGKNEINSQYNEYNFRLLAQFKEPYRLSVVSFLLLYTLWSLVLIFVIFSKQKIVMSWLLGIPLLTSLAYLGIMYLSYPLIHGERAPLLVSFLRYVHTVLLPLLLIGLGVLAPGFGASRFGKNSWQFINKFGVFAMALLLLFGFEKPVLSPFIIPQTFENHPSSIALQWSHFTRNTTEKMRNQLNNASVWIHLPITDNGLIATQIRYFLSPVRASVDTTRNIYDRRSGDLARLWDDYDYLWFPVINQNQDSMFYKKMGKKIPQSRFVKVIKREKHIELQPADMF